MWNKIKWFSVACFVLYTTLLLSPKLAATSVLVWVFALIGNAIWAIDSFKLKNWQWVVLGIFFCTLNILSIISRATGFEILTVVQPMLDTLGKLL